MVQLALAARLPGQLLVCAKSPALVPVTAMLLMVRGTVPVLVSFTAAVALVVPTFWLPKLTLVGLKLTTGMVVVPLPLSATFCGLPGPPSANVRLAVRLPLFVGVKVTLTLQDALAARLPGQLLVWAKSPPFVPVRPMLLMLKADVPLLNSLIVCAALVVPTFWLPKLTFRGLIFTDGITPVMKLLRILAVICCIPALA